MSDSTTVAFSAQTREHAMVPLAQLKVTPLNLRRELRGIPERGARREVRVRRSHRPRSQRGPDQLYA
jgi:hypothetical protein